ncbi:MAG: hypothetical protein IKU12_02840, partial [Oscillospiraceae bacterium]|nr:hypothetical protein [Oscillospiraceae bacterium]
MKKKRISALLLAFVLVLSLLSACGKEEEETAEVEVDAALVGDFTTLDPAYCTTDAEKSVILHLYENLMTVSTDAFGAAAAVPAAAERYSETVNYDGSVTYVFSIREDARWSDGTALTAEDFVFAWRRLADPKTASPNADLLRMVQGYEDARQSGKMEKLAVSVTEEGNLQVILAGNCPWFLTDICAAAETMPIREDVLAQQAEATAEGERLSWVAQAEMLVGNGAYIPENFNNGYLVLRQNSRYHHVESLGPDVLTFRLGMGEGDAERLFENGTTDFISRLGDTTVTENLAALRKADDTARPAPLGEVHCVLFNNSIGAFENAQLRQALSYAVDRASAAALCGADAVAASGLVPYGVAANADGDGDFRALNGDVFDLNEEAYEKNCADAKAALESAGYAGGENFPALEMIYPQENAVAANVTKTVCNQWKSVLGITVIPKAMSRSDYEAALAQGTYDVAYGFLSASYD